MFQSCVKVIFIYKELELHHLRIVYLACPLLDLMCKCLFFNVPASISRLL